MSYARMSGDYSDLYLIATWYPTNHLKYPPKYENVVWECISCKIKGERVVSLSKWAKELYIDLDINVPETITIVDSSYMFNLKAVYRHLRHHIMYGHKVPIDAVQRVVAEYYEIHVSRLQELWPHESWEFNTCNYCGGIAFNEDGASLTPYCDGECGMY